MNGYDKWSETLDPIKDIHRISKQVKGQVEKKTGKNYREFGAVKYRYQMTAAEGENYLIKVNVGGEDYIHLSLSQAIPFDGNIVVRDVQQDKTEDDPLTPFP